MKKLNTVLAILASAVLTACGGGSGGSPVGSTFTVTGVVAKGPATGAKVRIYATNDSGAKAAMLSEATSGSGGAYTLSIPPQTNPMLIEADLDGALIEDESTGVAFTGRTGDVMRAVFVPGAGQQSVNVTPFSHMAAMLVENNYRAEKIEAASAVVRQIVGNKDFLTVSPTASDGLRPQLTQLSRQSKTSEGSSSVQALLAQLAGAVKTNSDGSYGAGDDFVRGLCGNLGAECEGRFASQSSIVSVMPGPALTASAKAKALVQSLYDTISALHNDSQTGEVDTVIANLTEAGSKALAPSDNYQLDLINASAKAAKYLGTNMSSPIQFLGPYGSWILCHYGTYTGLGAGGRILSGSAWQSKPTAADATVVSCKTGGRIYSGFTLTTSMGAPIDVQNPQVRNQLVVWKDATSGTSNYASMVRVQPADASSTGFVMGGTDAIQYGTFTQGANGGGSFEGRLAPSAQHFWEFADWATAKANWLDYQYEDVSVGLSLTAGSSASAVPDAQIRSGSYFKLVKRDNSIASMVTIGQGSLTSTALNLDVSMQVPGMKVQGVVGLSRVDGQPRVASFTGTLYQQVAGNYVKFLEGSVSASAAQDDSNKKVDLIGKLFLAEREPLGVSIRAERAANGDKLTNGTLFWAGNSISVQPRTAGGYSVSHLNGTHFEVSSSLEAENVTIYVGELEVGSLRNRRAAFVDGSYFQF